jgi:preprotein translocase subunit SecD
MNRYPLWKNLLVALVLVISAIYSLPNLYPPDPAIQISGASSALAIDQGVLDRAREALVTGGVDVKAGEVGPRSGLLRLTNPEQQLRAQALVRRALGDDFVVALNLAPTTPAWLTAIGGTPLKLGLDLSGGVHFLLQVDTDAAVAKRIAVYESDLRKKLREAAYTRAGQGRSRATASTADVRDGRGTRMPPPR